jgi:DNA invertase Pin-like site-specific DNA recombinase
VLIGYARVSAPHQNLDRQLAMLKAEGCKRVFRELRPDALARGV